MKLLCEVVSGIVVRDGRIFLAQRKPTQDFPLTWESPGGKVDPNESWHGALRRELREELAIEVGELDEYPIASKDFDSPALGGRIFLHFYLVRDFAGEPRGAEGQGFGWFTADEHHHLALTPGNAEFRDLIERLVRESGRGNGAA